MISENNGQASTALHWIIGVHWAQWKSMQSSSLEYLIENDISHAGKDILDQARVSGRRHVRINGPGLEVIFALAQKGVDDEIGRFLKVVHATLKSKKKENVLKDLFYFFFGGLNSPLKLGNATLMLLSRTFSSNKSFLLKKTIKGISAKYTLLTISSKRLRLSCMRLTQWSSNRTWSYSDMATTNNTLWMMKMVFKTDIIQTEFKFTTCPRCRSNESTFCARIFVLQHQTCERLGFWIQTQSEMFIEQ